MSKEVTVNQVRNYWEEHPAGYDELRQLAHDPKKFLDERDRRTRLISPRIAEKYRMSLVRGLSVLDLGCGSGYNAQELVYHGARLTAVDLTTKGLNWAVTRFRIRMLSGDFVQANAERLPFRDGVFEFLHSSGVIHHSPDIEKTVDEIYRVLKPGGLGSIMIYHRSSLFYWYRLQVKLRLILIVLYLLPDELQRKLVAWRPAWAAFVPEAWPTAQDALNAGTDSAGLENPLSRVFTKRTARRLFRRFIVEGFATSQGGYKPLKAHKNILERAFSLIWNWVANRWGWYLYVYIKKPDCD